MGAQLGVLVEFGTHVNSIGLQTKGYLGTSFTQLNIGNTIRFNLNHLAGRKNFWENRSYVGGAFMFGKERLPIDFDLDGLNHQSARPYAIAYNYVCYWDQANTSQVAGGFALHLGQLSMRVQNDIFSGNGRDRFRTAHFYMNYRWDFVKVGVGAYLWTGETRGAIWDKTPGSKMPNGYRTIDHLPYGKTSHGIFYVSGSYHLPYGNTAFLRMGIDSEQIRHVLQNRLFHDLIFLPKQFPRHTPHYPRLDENGFPVFDAQSRKKDKFYAQFGLNDNWGD